MVVKKESKKKRKRDGSIWRGHTHKSDLRMIVLYSLSSFPWLVSSASHSVSWVSQTSRLCALPCLGSASEITPISLWTCEQWAGSHPLLWSELSCPTSPHYPAPNNSVLKISYLMDLREIAHPGKTIHQAIHGRICILLDTGHISVNSWKEKFIAVKLILRSPSYTGSELLLPANSLNLVLPLSLHWLTLTATLLPQTLKCWDFRHA